MRFYFNKLKAPVLLIASQVVLALLISVVSLIIFGSHAATSALFAGLVAVVPNLMFALMIFFKSDVNTLNKWHLNFLIGGFLKFVLTVLLFALLFVLYDVHTSLFFVTYTSVLMVNWLVILVSNNEKMG